MTFWFALFGAFALTPLVVAGAPRWSLIDLPNHRSSHDRPIPRGGGLAIVVAASVSLLAVHRSPAAVGLVAGAATLGLVGLVDDRMGVPALPRLAAQFVVPIGVALFVTEQTGVRLVVMLVVAAFAVAGYVNVFNFMDGINGISGSQAAITGLFLAAVADDAGAPALTAAGLAVCGAAAGFLPFNALRPRIFLGDVGSYFLGFWLVGLALLCVDAGAAPVVVVGPFLLYLLDTATVLLRRFRRGDNLLEAHREHAYQRLTQAGWSHLAVALLCAAVTATCALVMLALLSAPGPAQVAGLLVCLALVGAYLALPSRVGGRAIEVVT